MLSLHDFQKNFAPFSVPEILTKLLDFQCTIPDEAFYSQGFTLQVTGNLGIRTYCQQEEFMNSIFEFAQADWTGSTYALWLANATDDLNKAPVIIFGSEGGYHVVATNLLEWLQILTLDAEPLVDWDKVFYFKDKEDYIPPAYHSRYCQWLLDTYSLSPVQDVDTIVQHAQEEYKVMFDEWMEMWYKNRINA